MTNAQEAELRGEIYGLKILLVNCLAAVSSAHSDPVNFLESIKNESVAGIAKATNDAVKPAYLQTYQDAAARVVRVAVGAARATAAPSR